MDDYQDDEFKIYENPIFGKLNSSRKTVINQSELIKEGPSSNCKRSGASKWEQQEKFDGSYYWNIQNGIIVVDNKNDSESSEQNTFFSTNLSNQFVVCPLGCVEIDDNEINAEMSPKIIQRCINELNKNQKNNNIQNLLKIDNGFIKILTMNNEEIINQPICHIRLWGLMVSKFAFVVKDSNLENNALQNKLKCYVFYVGEDSPRLLKTMKSGMNLIKSPIRKSTSIDIKSSSLENIEHIEFPAPMEQPRKTILAKYLGKTRVSKPIGVNILNSAIDKITFLKGLSNETDESMVLVHVSPSNVCIEAAHHREKTMEFRVRYISFLGISRDNVKHCGIIVQSEDKTFEAYCLECEPNAGLLCKTIEAACKLRFQKCLDAHKQRVNTSKTNSLTKSASSYDFRSNIKNAISRILN